VPENNEANGTGSNGKGVGPNLKQDGTTPFLKMM